MARRSRKLTALAGTVVAILLIGAATQSAAAERGETTRTFKPVKKKPRALVFAPRTSPHAVVRKARVRLRNRRTGVRRIRRLGVRRVTSAATSRSVLKIRKAPKANGRLKIEVGVEDPADATEPDPVEPGSDTDGTAGSGGGGDGSTDPGGDGSSDEGGTGGSGGDSSGPSPSPSPSPIPTTWRRFASFEDRLNSGIDYGWRVDSPFEVTRTSEAGASDGSHAVKIRTAGGSNGCSCPRMTFDDGFSLGPGSSVWISGSWRIPNPSRLAWSRLMNLGHFVQSESTKNYYTGLVVRSGGQMSVSTRQYNTDAGMSTLMSDRPIPVNRWFRVDLHLKLSPTDGQALTEVYLDGELIARSTRRNMMHSGPLHFFNAGLPYFWPESGDMTVYFDAPRLIT